MIPSTIYGVLRSSPIGRDISGGTDAVRSNGAITTTDASSYMLPYLFHSNINPMRYMSSPI